MKYFFYLLLITGTLISCDTPDQNSAAGNSVDVRDSATKTNPNTNVDDSTNQVASDTSHHH